MSTEITITSTTIDINVTESPITIEAPSGAYPLPTDVYSVFGRTGNIVATEGDYTLTQLAGVTITSPVSGQALVYNGTSWVNNTETYVGTVTSVAALTLGTTGTDLTSSVVNSTTTPVITLNVPTASASNRGALSSADWSTFNAKQVALNGTGFVKIVGTTISYDNSTYYLDSNPTAYIPLTALSSTATGLTYTNTTGVFSTTGGYGIPTTAKQTTWDTAYNDSIISASVTGVTTKTLTLNQQDGGTIVTTWTDYDTAPVTSVFGRTGAVVAVNGDYTTSLVTEGTNLYYTQARFDTAFAAKSTTDLAEGANLYYTDVRARASNSFVAGSGAYNSTTGVITIPTNNNQITNGAAYITLTSLSVTTPLSYNNTTGAFTISQATTSTNGYLTSTDWNTFNNKEGAVTAGTTLQYYRGDKTFQTLDTTVVVEGTNLYYTQARFDSAFGAKSTTNLAEGTNLYYTDTRARAAITGTSPISVTSGVVAISQSNTTTNGYLSFTDWNTFNAKQDALNGTGFVKITGTTISYDNSTYLTTISGIAAGGELSGTYANPTLVNSAVIGKVLTGVNITGGTVVDTDSILTAFGKVQNQINGLIGGSIYKGTWNANTNTPALASGVGVAGNYYIVSVAGTTNLDGITDWQVGDWVIYQGSEWEKVDNTDAVVSVNGFTGAVSLSTSNINEGSNLYFTNARAIASSLTAYTSGAGVITSADTILTAIQKLNGNTSAIVSGVSSVYGRTGAVVANTGDYTTSQVTEGSNLYYTQARFDTAFGLKTTTNLTEGSNLYYTDTRARLSLSFVTGSGAYNSTTGVITIPTNNNEITNGSNYITLTSLSSSATGLTYTNTTGVFSLSASYVIPTTASATEWDTAYTNRITSATSPLSITANAISITQATTSVNGYLTSTDWNTFNNKQSSLTLGNLTSTDITVTGGTGSIIGAGSTLTLATVNANVGTFGSSSAIPVITVNAKGLITSLTTTPVSIPSGALDFIGDVTGSGTTGSNTTLTLATVNSNVGAFGSSTYVPTVTVNAKGLVTAISQTIIATADTSTTGLLTFTDWNTFNGKQGTITLTTTGSSGGSSLVSNTLNIPTYTLTGLGGVPTTRTLTINGTGYDLSADRSWTIPTSVNATFTQDYTATAAQTTFTVTGGYTVGQLAVYYNGSKLASAEFTASNGTTFVLATACQVNDIVQAVVEITGGGIGGSGTTNYVSKFTASGVLGNSLIFDNGTNVGIGNTNTTYKLDVSGTGNFTGALTGTSATFSGNVGVGANPNQSGIGSSNRVLTVKAATSGGEALLELIGLGNNATDNIAKISFMNQAATTALASIEAIRGSSDTVGELSFKTSNTTRLTIASTGAATFSSSVGVGGSPTGTYGTLSVFGGISIKNDNNAKFEIGRYSSGASNSYIKLGANSNSLRVTDNLDQFDIFTITNAGNVGIGTSSPSKKLDIFDNNAGGSDDIVKAYQDLATNHAFYRSQRNGGANMLIGATRNNVDGNLSANISILWNVSNNDMAFGTNNTERMRITSGGLFKFQNNGSSYESSTAGVNEFNTAANDTNVVFRNTASSLTGARAGVDVFYTAAAPNNGNAAFYQAGDYSGGRTTRFSVTSNGNVYNVTGTYTSGVSDIRYKEQIVDANSQWDDIKSLRVVNFKFIKDVKQNGDAALRQIGFIAQEVEKISPNLVEEMSDEVETWKTIKASIIHTKAIKALQEAMIRIESLEAQIEELKKIVATK